ncbi:MAG TPA: zinc ribbon domain-containing protein [Bacteroidales bacterium]|nr:zinc ribbon domain-containing protein [Bacteroidales bacterium]
MNICDNCGVELDDNFKICPLCGKNPLTAAEGATLNNPSGIIQIYNREVRKFFWELAGIIAFCAVSVGTIVDLITNRKPTWSLFSGISIFAAWTILTVFLHAGRRLLIIIPGLLITTLASLVVFDLLLEGKTWFLPVALPLTLAVFVSTGIIIVLYKAANFKGLNILAFSTLILSGLCIVIELLLDRFENGFADLRWSLIAAISIFPVSALLLFYHYRLKRGNRLDSYFHI